MIQFTEEEVRKLRKKSNDYPRTIRKLKEKVDEVFKGEIIVPESGIANWTHYYFCPDCSIELIYKRNSPAAHVCPGCGKIFTGEPYDSAWWGLINGENNDAVYNMAIIWLATGEEAYAKKAIEILMPGPRHWTRQISRGDLPWPMIFFLPA